MNLAASKKVLMSALLVAGALSGLAEPALEAAKSEDPTGILRKPIPDKLVVLTFDDGPASHATVVAPILKSLGFGGSFYQCIALRDMAKYIDPVKAAKLPPTAGNVKNAEPIMRVKGDKPYFGTEIRNFSFPGLASARIIGTNVTLSVPSSTNVTSLAPAIKVSKDATIAPASGIARDFTKPRTYTVTSRDGSTSKRLGAAFKRAKDKGLWNDGFAAQRFRRVTSEKPVSLFDSLVKWFPDQSPELFKKCLEGGDILVNGKPTNATVEITTKDKVFIVFGGPKQCYALANRAEYWAEGYQSWYDTNRTMDHDHNHIHTREKLLAYDTGLGDLCREVLGQSEWRFVSPRKRAGIGHLKGYDPATAPKVKKLEHIEKAANDYYDTYWKSYWPRLYGKHSLKVPASGKSQ